MNLKSSDVKRITSKIDSAIKTLNKGNPYHDKLGKFTWSPFGKYKGDPYKAECIMGAEYKKAIKGFEDTLDFAEKQLVIDYADSPSIGNSSAKNGEYDVTTMFFTKDGQPISFEESKRAKELYDQFRYKIDEDLTEEQAQAKKEFMEKYTFEKGQLVPEVQLKILKESAINDPELLVDKKELIDKASKLADDRFQYLSSYDFRDIQRGHELMSSEYVNRSKDYEELKKIYESYTPEQKIAAEVLQKKTQYSGEGETRNVFKYPYGEDSIMETTKYPNSGIEMVGTTLQEISSWSDAKLKKYLDFYNKTNSWGISEYLMQEIDGRKLDRLIEKKGITFDKDIVVTRRVLSDKVIQQEIDRQGFYTQSGFTSTSAANRLARKSPGGMIFGNKLIKIVIPAGTRVLPVEAVLKGTPEYDSLWSQHEILLPSNTKYIGVDRNNPKNIKITDTSKYSPTLHLDKVNRNLDELDSLVAITDQYQRSH